MSGGWRGLFRRRRPEELALIDADITAFGEELAAYEFVPAGRHTDTDALVLGDYERALDAYERAKRALVGDRDREDAEDVVRALQDGRHALACARARAAGLPLPERRGACFFDPRHGPSVTSVQWTPPEGATRPVDVCAADAVRLQEGLTPIATGRTSVRASVRAPLWTPARNGGGSARAHRTIQPAVPAQPPASGGHRRPYRTWPATTPVAQRAEGRGDGEADLVRPDPDQPVLLVVRLDGPGRAELAGFPASRTLLKADSGGRRTVVPLPPDGGVGVGVVIRTSGLWRAWLQPAEHIPVLESQLNSRGPYVFRYAGGPATLLVSQRGGGVLRLHELTDSFEAEEPLLTGRNTCNGQARLAGPALVRLHSTGDWHVSLR
ncbi:hypothetical protein ACFYYS_06895 [Streptomyces sp. NPDC002120]|uniref:hypothetical protein n=1 Tax=Streptomyces sp. NPDC002120 TaxID=3364631 RepID=UPI0036BAB200